MGYQFRAFCVGIKNENIQFIIHFDVTIYRIRIILAEKELIFVRYTTQTITTLTIVKRTILKQPHNTVTMVNIDRTHRHLFHFQVIIEFYTMVFGP